MGWLPAVGMVTKVTMARPGNYLSLKHLPWLAHFLVPTPSTALSLRPISSLPLAELPFFSLSPRPYSFTVHFSHPTPDASTLPAVSRYSLSLVSHDRFPFVAIVFVATTVPIFHVFCSRLSVICQLHHGCERSLINHLDDFDP